ncbi:hypothetical protein BH10PLA2_BH10PLA2_35850 [soil metagenome]
MDEQEPVRLNVWANCSRRILREHNFYQWRKLLGERDHETRSFSPSTLFVPVEFADVSIASRIEIVLSGSWHINISTGSDVATLA